MGALWERASGADSQPVSGTAHDRTAAQGQRIPKTWAGTGRGVTHRGPAVACFSLTLLRLEGAGETVDFWKAQAINAKRWDINATAPLEHGPAVAQS